MEKGFELAEALFLAIIEVQGAEKLLKSLKKAFIEFQKEENDLKERTNHLIGTTMTLCHIFSICNDEKREWLSSEWRAAAEFFGELYVGANTLADLISKNE